MIRLHFKVDPSYLTYYMLVNCASNNFIKGTPDPEVVAFENLAWKKDKDAYEFLRYGPTEFAIIDHLPLGELATRADKLLANMIAEPSYKPLEGQTLQSLSKTREEWEADYPKSYAIMLELTGLSFDQDFDVYMTHPSQRNGRGGLKIRWTYRQDFPHYNTVYLWHEILHTFLPSKSGESVVNVEHAVIELLTDNELRSRLNGNSYPPFIGHKELVPMKEVLLESWKTYLKEPHKDINAYLKQAQEIVAKHEPATKET